jgi:hypothetical protein
LDQNALTSDLQIGSQKELTWKQEAAKAAPSDTRQPLWPDNHFGSSRRPQVMQQQAKSQFDPDFILESNDKKTLCSQSTAVPYSVLIIYRTVSRIHVN